jgi:DNA-directed RNA polymerase specialized sigma24 family protein
MPGDTTFGTYLCEVPLDQLVAEARARERRHPNEGATDDAPGLELFRRAMAEGDEAAWHAIVELYRGPLLAQAGRHAVRPLVSESDAFCVDRAFERFWCATRTGRIGEFNDLASIFKYLKLCLASVLIDEARARRRRADVSLEDVSVDAWVSADPSARVIGRLAERELWQAIERELVDANERLVARLSFVAGLSPREIVVRRPDKFSDVVDVYRVKRNMVERLRRSRAIQRLLDRSSGAES